MKTSIFNLIILDESGSMCGVKEATISGCNETLSTIRATQEKYADTQEHFVSIFAFQTGTVPSRYIIKNAPAAEVKDINGRDYQPCGCTPLYDAIGSTLVDLKKTAEEHTFAVGNVTIITDGMENSSQHYTHEKVTKMIDALKEMGWSFNFIGANIDVQRTAASLNIDNALEFKQDDAGTRAMFEKERRSRMAWMDRVECAHASFNSFSPKSAMDREAMASKLKEAAKGYFEEEDDHKDQD